MSKALASARLKAARALKVNPADYPSSQNMWHHIEMLNHIHAAMTQAVFDLNTNTPPKDTLQYLLEAQRFVDGYAWGDYPKTPFKQYETRVSGLLALGINTWRTDRVRSLAALKEARRVVTHWRDQLAHLRKQVYLAKQRG